MKKIFLIPALLLSTALAAQQTQGTVTYQQIARLDFKGSGLPEEMAGMLPKEQKAEKTLYFNADAALYENKESAKAEEPTEISQDNINIRIDRQVPEEKIYTDLQQKKRIAQRDLMGRTFLVDEAITDAKWKFTGRQKKILDMPCMEAYYLQDRDSSGQDSVIAWYTTAIPVAAGPEGFAGLPGLILEVQPGKQMHIVATQIDNAVATNKIKAPSKGKKISPEAFEKLQKEKMEEMQKQYGGKGNVIIINRGN